MLNVARSKPVVAIAASLMTIALIGGTAVAARLITSADIKDETIRERDLRPSLVDRINRRGPRGRAGGSRLHDDSDNGLRHWSHADVGCLV